MRLWRAASETENEGSEADVQRRRRPASMADDAESGASAPRCRESHGIQCLFDHLPKVPGLQILDLGMLTEATSRYMGQLGHYVYTASLLHSFDKASAEASRTEEGGLGRQGATRFVRTHLDFPPNTFHAVLAWDVLQHLDEETMRSTVAHLAKIVRPNGTMLCLFHSDTNNAPVPIFDCAVASDTTLLLKEVGRRRRSREFSARKLESIFPQFRAVHFYLKRDALLEVLVLN